MKLYLKIAGYFALIDWFTGVITYIVYMSHVYSKSDNSYKFLLIIILFIFLIIGPAFALLFLSHSNSLENNEKLEKELDEYINKTKKEKSIMIGVLDQMQNDLEEEKSKIDKNKGEK